MRRVPSFLDLAAKPAGKTPVFRDPSGAVLRHSIAEAVYLPLGGLEQWVLIRGADIENPVLIVLSGGPGFSDTPFLRHHNAALEQHFTVVYWDQRGTRKSYAPDIPLSSMTCDQFIADLDELVDIVRDRLGKAKAIIFGHSWGTVLGCLYVSRFPGKVSAYAGCGQIGDWAASEAGSYAYALSEAERLGNQKALDELRGIGPPPYSADALWTQRNWLQTFDGKLRWGALWQFGRIFLGGPESSIFDAPTIMKSFRFSLGAMWEEVSRLDLNELAPTLAVPVFFLLGRHDHWVPPETSVAYLERLSAPSKQIVWFEESGHEAFVDEAEKFNRVMVEEVRSAAL
jgi:pimeloyl-ACP methyl ester carboxylesterase